MYSQSIYLYVFIYYQFLLCVLPVVSVSLCLYVLLVSVSLCLHVLSSLCVIASACIINSLCIMSTCVISSHCIMVQCFRCVLAATCDYFKTSFSFSDFSQSLSRVDLTDVGSDVKAVKRVIQSLYTNEIDLEPNYVESILRLADYFLHDRLRLCIEKYMVSTVDFDTAVLYFQLAFQYRLLEVSFCLCIISVLYIPSGIHGCISNCHLLLCFRMY